MNSKTIVFLFVVTFILSGCSNTNKVEINSCTNKDSEAEKDCFLKLVCKNKDFDLCERMPDDTNERQSNKAFCLSFVTSLTHDLNYCRKQKNSYYANACEMGYQRWIMSFEPEYLEEFKELKSKYGCEFEKKELEEQPKEKELTGFDKMEAEIKDSMSYKELINYCVEDKEQFYMGFNCFMIGVRKIMIKNKEQALQYCEKWGKDYQKDALYDMCLSIVNKET
ncbi:hypothetical protein HYX02_00350 [Candidatus Woesearchaeota archaeon]|nr:hypothetical protein [Candidatus Woesearchaeota archaeon]